MPANPSAKPDAAPPPVIIVGAGPSGLAAAAMLGRARVPAVVLERCGHVGEHWRGHYDALRLHTTRALSALPGLPLPRRTGTWVSRDDWADYLERYAAHHRLDIRPHTPVEELRPATGLGPPAPRTPAPAGGPGAPAGGPRTPSARWHVHTARGEFAARAVVVATGRNHTPYVPEWPGLASFTGRFLHSREHRDAESYRGRTVLVVGSGNSGTEIAAALGQAQTERVWLSVRTPPNIVPKAGSQWQAPGLWAHHLPPAWGDLATALMRRLLLPDLEGHGLPRPTEGLYTRSARDEISPVIDRGIVEAVRSARVRPVAAVRAMDGPRVMLADGSHLTPDVVIAATGYVPGLAGLMGGLPLLDDRGGPLVRGAETSPEAPGLYFTGYANPLSGALHQSGVDARRIARAIRRTTGRPVAWLPRPRSPKVPQH